MHPNSPRTVPSDLWSKLVALDLDGGAQLSFSKRLARDNGWSSEFAQRVVLEYKKFVFLAATCGHPVTPSDEVDQAWHLHLVYTRSYWDELCGQVLGFPLHHGPTKGGAAEGHKFQDWYARTLQAYVGAFGTAPPIDIWPLAAVRFGEAPYFRRVNLRRQWVLSRPRWTLRLGRGGWAALMGALMLVGCTTRLPINPFNWHGAEFLFLFWGLCAVILASALWFRQQSSGAEDAYVGPPPGTYQVARLVDWGDLLVDSALAAMAHSEKIELLPGQKVKRLGTTPPDDFYERAVWHLIIASGWSRLDEIRAKAPSLKTALRALDEALEQQGLLLPPAERQRLDRIPLLAALVLGSFGLTKLLVGLSRDRPVGFLFLSLLVLGGVVWVCQQRYGAWATGRGRRLLREIAAKVRQSYSADTHSSETVALTVAFFGIAKLSTLGMGQMAAHLSPPSSSDGGGDSGGGDSGGGDSGCGGCGGCGGGGD